MNLPFCLWLYAYGRKNGGMTVMFHEVQFGILPGDPMRYRMIAATTKVMAMLAARAAAHIFIAAPGWEPLLRPYIADGQPVTWMPVPSTIAVIENRARITAKWRGLMPGSGRVIGHFGTYSRAIAAMLLAIIPRVLTIDSSVMILLIGANSEAFRDVLVSANRGMTERIRATGALPADELSLAISSCDVMMQPYPDGVSSRRTTVMAALNHARAIVTTKGSFTEPLWEQSGAVILVEPGDIGAFASAVRELSEHAFRRYRYANAAKALYANRFDLSHTIRILRATAREKSYSISRLVKPDQPDPIPDQSTQARIAGAALAAPW